MASDIYLSKAILESYEFNTDCDGKFGGGDTLQLFHKPCEELVHEIPLTYDQELPTPWTFMEEMSDHNRACPSNRWRGGNN